MIKNSPLSKDANASALGDAVEMSLRSTWNGTVVNVAAVASVPALRCRRRWRGDQDGRSSRGGEESSSRSSRGGEEELLDRGTRNSVVVTGMCGCLHLSGHLGWTGRLRIIVWKLHIGADRDVVVRLSDVLVLSNQTKSVHENLC